MTERQGIDWQAVRRRISEGEKAIGRTLSPDAATLRAAMRQRAAILAARRQPGAEEPRLQVLSFWLGEERCAVETTAVAEVLPFRRCTPVPGMPADLLGVVNLRGRIRPVVDLPRLVKAKGAGVGDGYILFLRDHPNEIGARVDGIGAVCELQADRLSRPGEAEGGLSSRFARGISPEGVVVLEAQSVIGALRAVLAPA